MFKQYTKTTYYKNYYDYYKSYRNDIVDEAYTPAGVVDNNIFYNKTDSYYPFAVPFEIGEPETSTSIIVKVKFTGRYCCYVGVPNTLGYDVCKARNSKLGVLSGDYDAPSSPTTIQNNSLYWIQTVFTAEGTSIYLLQDDSEQYTLDTLPALTDWSVETENDTRLTKADVVGTIRFLTNTNLNRSYWYLKGYLYGEGCAIYQDGEEIWRLVVEDTVNFEYSQTVAENLRSYDGEYHFKKINHRETSTVEDYDSSDRSYKEYELFLPEFYNNYYNFYGKYVKQEALEQETPVGGDTFGVTQSSYFSPGYGYNATNPSSTQRWQSQNGLDMPQDLVYYYPEGINLVSIEFNNKAISESEAKSYAIKDYEIHVSDNGVEYTLLGSYTNTVVTPGSEGTWEIQTPTDKSWKYVMCRVLSTQGDTNPCMIGYMRPKPSTAPLNSEPLRSKDFNEEYSFKELHHVGPGEFNDKDILKTPPYQIVRPVPYKTYYDYYSVDIDSIAGSVAYPTKIPIDVTDEELTTTYWDYYVFWWNSDYYYARNKCVFLTSDISNPSTGAFVLELNPSTVEDVDGRVDSNALRYSIVFVGDSPESVSYIKWENDEATRHGAAGSINYRGYTYYYSEPVKIQYIYYRWYREGVGYERIQDYVSNYDTVDKKYGEQVYMYFDAKYGNNLLLTGDVRPGYFHSLNKQWWYRRKNHIEVSTWDDYDTIKLRGY